ncbi:terminase large subunit domain-containing protein [Providencia huaxiensis]|uniref:Terminase family protein n=1 Tax=Providencia huaxiensis TaxID=2027290 RepID=A0A8I2DBH3_9GAMM|nr:terminase family protein [Providencia huaxiensis]MBQ0269564.1 terminase family protein [Providencia huaxiensis]
MNFKIEVTTELLIDLYANLENLLPWQSRWYQHRFDRFRFLHKGRQIGASDYFSLEALLDACLTGENKTFIAPTSSDEDDFMCSEFYYMIRHAKVDESLLGNEKIIQLSNGAKIYFLSDKDEIPDDCGDIYLSEWAWFDNPNRTLETTKIMASTNGIVMINDSALQGAEFELLVKSLKEASNKPFKNLFVYGEKNNRNIEVIPLSKQSNKGRITLYSSRHENDSGHCLEPEQMFSGYYDVVPNVASEIGRDFIDAERRSSQRLAFGDELFNQLFLCHLPAKKA